MNTEASKRIRIKTMANISALQNPMPILCVATIEAVIDEMYAPIFIFFLIQTIKCNINVFCCFISYSYLSS